jgi:predicted small lipoprotein YifL
MKNANRVLLVMAVVMGLTACGPKETVQTVDWYKAHDVERKAMVDQCNANPGELDSTPNCVNATNAANALVWSAKGGISGVKAPTFGKKPTKPTKE